MAGTAMPAVQAMQRSAQRCFLWSIPLDCCEVHHAPWDMNTHQCGLGLYPSTAKLRVAPGILTFIPSMSLAAITWQPSLDLHIIQYLLVSVCDPNMMNYHCVCQNHGLKNSCGDTKTMALPPLLYSSFLAVAYVSVRP